MCPGITVPNYFHVSLNSGTVYTNTKFAAINVNSCTNGVFTFGYLHYNSKGSGIFKYCPKCYRKTINTFVGIIYASAGNIPEVYPTV